MSQDRLRLKLGPPAVGVPQGLGDLYFSEDGVLMKQTPSGGSEPVVGGGSASISNAEYSSDWNGYTNVAPSKNAVRDKLVTMDAAIDGKQPLDADLTAYAADPTAAILANMPDALSGSSDPSAGDFASGSRDFTGVTINQGYKVVVGAYTFTWKNSPVGLFEIVAESPYFPSIEAGKLRDAVNASGIAFTATASANVTSITADAVGEESNGGVMSGGADPTASGVFVGQLYRNTTGGTWWRWNGTAWVEDASPDSLDAAITAHSAATDPHGDRAYADTLVTREALLDAFGIPTHADLTAANIALGIGKPFFNTALLALDITTA